MVNAAPAMFQALIYIKMVMMVQSSDFKVRELLSKWFNLVESQVPYL